MRYDTSSIDSSTAHDIINNGSELELISILKKFGEEKFSELIASQIMKARSDEIINTTG